MKIIFKMKNGEEYSLSKQIYGASGAFPDRTHASTQLNLITEKLRFFTADDGTVIFCKHISNAWIEENPSYEDVKKVSDTVFKRTGNIDLIKRSRSEYLKKNIPAKQTNDEKLKEEPKKPITAVIQKETFNDDDLNIDKPGFNVKKLLGIIALLAALIILISLCSEDGSKSGNSSVSNDIPAVHSENSREETPPAVRTPVVETTNITALEKYFNSHQKSTIDFSNKCPSEFQALYDLVKDKISQRELSEIINRTPSELDEYHMKKLRDIASPQSVKKQKQMHKDYVPILVNDKTVEKGLQFFQEKKDVLMRAYGETGVKPEDILAILNWESKFGEHLGTYSVYKIFIGQFCYLSEIEEDLFQNDAYNSENAMPREKALKRIERLKKSSVKNMASLILLAIEKKYNLYDIKGSWGGAIGIPQFMPASMTYAADGNGDGEIDLNNMDDAIFSIANYLKVHEYSQKGSKYAFQRYNNEEMYVRGVTLYSQMLISAGLSY